ncbi:hypothetical protein [Chitinophaga qingshengii]|uniref:Uncharacterized protein n=1 Tax=Chitinophaga qingshengii TaxID=1569794 RepID=A0ABR7THB7_9BACT|nr:hypothetical protein [Chitinophaga qingshengii]MBC9929887.1 hypothetical protein [Chitinophaga qingshengii]
MNFEGDCLREAGLLDAPSLQSVLGEGWTDDDVRRIYPLALPQATTGRKVELVRQLADTDGYARLYRVGQYYLFESVDGSMHEVFASEPLMLDIIAAMQQLKRTA